MINFLDVIYPGEYPINKYDSNITLYTILGISAVVIIVVAIIIAVALKNRKKS